MSREDLSADDGFVDALETQETGEEKNPASEFADASASWSSSHPLHAAAWENDVERIEALLRRSDVDVNALDVAGHGALHVAALRRAVGAVGALTRDARVDVERRDARGWTAARLAAARRARACARMIVAAGIRRQDGEKKRFGDALRGCLGEVGDFETRAAWRFGSSVLAPLVKMVAPKDAYEVTVCGNRLRIDGELRGIDSEAMARSVIPRWRRGKFSLIFDGTASGDAKLWFVDHESREVVDATAKPSERASADDSASKSSAEPARTEDEIVDAMTEELLAEGGKKRRVRWENLSFVPARGWVSSKATTWIKGRRAEIWEASARMMRETVVPGDGRCLDHTYEEYAERASEWGENVVHRKPLGASSRDESGLDEFEDEATKAERAKREKREKSRKMTARCWLVRDFPIKAAHASSILDVLARANKHAERVNRVFKYWCEHHAEMFPVKIQVPLMLTIYAQLQFKDFKKLEPRERDAKLRDGFFDVPKDYRVKSVEEMLAEVEERAVRDIEALEALEGGEAVADENETEEMRKWRLELERIAALEASSGDELDDADASSSGDERENTKRN